MFLFSMRDDWPQFLTYLDGMELTKPQSWKGHRKRLFPSQHVLIVLAHGCLFDVPSTFLWWFGTWMDDFSSSLCEFTRGYLVGGDWNHGIWIDFPYFSIGNVIIPTDFHSIIFQRDRSNTNQWFSVPIPGIPRSPPQLCGDGGGDGYTKDFGKMGPPRWNMVKSSINHGFSWFFLIFCHLCFDE